MLRLRVDHLGVELRVALAHGLVELVLRVADLLLRGRDRGVRRLLLGRALGRQAHGRRVRRCRQARLDARGLALERVSRRPLVGPVVGCCACGRFAVRMPAPSPCGWLGSGANSGCFDRKSTSARSCFFELVGRLGLLLEREFDRRLRLLVAELLVLVAQQPRQLRGHDGLAARGLRVGERDAEHVRAAGLEPDRQAQLVDRDVAGRARGYGFSLGSSMIGTS